MDWKQATDKLKQLFPDDAKRGRIKAKLLNLPLEQMLLYFDDTDAAVWACLHSLDPAGKCHHSGCLQQAVVSNDETS
jgi:hypothetical protein